MGEHFGVIDYLVFFVSLTISFTIGIFFAIWDKIKKRNSPDDYFIAGRKSGTFPVAMSFIVTFQSSLLMLAAPVEVYAYSMMYCYSVVGIMISYIFAGFVVVPVIYPLKITSVNKYFFLRYGDNLLRYLGVFTGVVYNIFYMGTVTYGTCVAAEVVVGIPYWGTVLIYTTMTTIYTSIGGIKAVIWADVFQLCIMMLGIIAVLAKTTVDVGGPLRVFELAKDQLFMGNMNLDPTVRYTFLNVSIGTCTVYLYLCLSQSGIQRVNSTPSVKVARRIYILSAPIYSIITFMAAYEGVTIFAYYASKGCDIFNGGLIDNINQILPVTVLQLFQNLPGVTGIFIASLSCAAVSTVSSCLSSLSAITYEDVIRVIYPNMEESKATTLSKIVVLLYGLIAMAMTFLISDMPGSIIKIFDGIMGCINGPACAMFLLSLLFKRASSKGVFIGTLSGMAFSFWLFMGRAFSTIPEDPKLPSGPTENCYLYANISYMSPKHDSLSFTNLTQNGTTTPITVAEPGTIGPSFLEKMYTVSYILISPIGFSVAVLVSVIFSFLTKSPDYVDERCVFSFNEHIIRDVFGRRPATLSQQNDNNDHPDSDDDVNELTNLKHKI